MEPASGDASACLRLRSPVILRGCTLVFQTACPSLIREFPRKKLRSGLKRPPWLSPRS